MVPGVDDDQLLALCHRVVDAVAGALATLEDWRPGGERRGQYALDLRGAYRLVFVPDHDPIPNLPGGGVDEALVTKVLITEVVDYHGR